MKLSVIVPMLNEADALASLLDKLEPVAHRGMEVILADGGSDDGSAAIAERAGFMVVRSARGRARQMNAAAAHATGNVLVFLHADTQLPEDADRLITHALSSGTHCWGRFDVRISGHAYMLRIVSHLMNVRSRITGIATGDQAMFVMRNVFDAVGGFPDQPLMEDIELSRRLLRRSRPACIGQCVITSGRRWERDGVWRTILLMWRLRWNYWRGVPAHQLAKVYR